MVETRKHPKAVIWFDSFGATGPVSVVNRLSESLKARGVEVVLAGSDRSLNHTFPEGVRQAAIRPHIGWLKAEISMSKPLKKILDAEKPDILITEHFPYLPNEALGKDMEEAVTYARQHFPQMQIYGVPRDFPYILTDDDAKHATQVAADLYDGILVRGDEKVLDFKQDIGPLNVAKIKDKLHYIGYTVPPMAPTAKRSGGGVVVHLGGGHPEWDKATYTELLQALPHLSAELQAQSWHFYLSPNTDKKARQAIEQARGTLEEPLRSQVHIHEPVRDFPSVLQSADMVVARGGITAVEAVAYGKPAVILPLYQEQRVRSAGLSAVAGERVAVLEVPTPDAKHPVHYARDDLKSHMEKMFAARRVKAGDCPFAVNGHEHAAQAIVDRFNGIETAFEGRKK